MTNRIFQKLAVVAAGTVLSLTVMKTEPTQAAIITYDLTVDVTSGPLFGNQYSVFFSYDDSAPGAPYLLPFFDVIEFYFEFNGKIVTKNNLQFPGCRYGIEYCFPLYIPGGEFLGGHSGIPVSLIPRGGQLHFSFGAFDLFEPYYEPYSGGFGLGGSSSSGSFYYELPVEDYRNPEFPHYEGFGTVTVSLRQTPTPAPTSVPEPGTILGLSVLGLGWLLKKKKVSSQST